MSKTAPNKISNQIVGNIGLFWVSYRLSQLGWNVMTTTRNAKGADLAVYNKDGTKRYLIQVKALTKGHNTVNLGKDLKWLGFVDYLIVCMNVDEEPCIYVFETKTQEDRHRIKSMCKKYKDNFWMQLNKVKHNYKENSLGTLGDTK
ncbi:MAG: hypothetical protein QW478_14780 [Candidatus Micrarchaeaceae archaeon]